MAITYWQGKSALDGQPIRVMLTERSENAKTGPMRQAWIVPAAGRKAGQASVCGDCPLGRAGACYVDVRVVDRIIAQGPRAELQDVPPEPIRLGAWGDPAAVPQTVIKALLRGVKRWTGYTHQWRAPLGSVGCSATLWHRWNRQPMHGPRKPLAGAPIAFGQPAHSSCRATWLRVSGASARGRLRRADCARLWDRVAVGVTP